jgi:hypothetical protein
LTYFKFIGFNLSIPPGFCFFKRLLSLHFFSVVFESGALENLISGCPLLEKLSIDLCYGFKYFDFSVPSLKVLLLDFDHNMKHSHKIRSIHGEPRTGSGEPVRGAFANPVHTNSV